MAIKICPKGHHYNTDDNDSCPYCEQTNSSSNFDWSEADLSDVAFPMGNNWNRQAGSDDGDKTESINHSGRNNSKYDDWDEKTQSMGNYSRKNDWNDSRVSYSEDDDIDAQTRSMDGFKRVKRGNHNPTPESEGNQSGWDSQEYQQQQVVGWLVCIEGPDKGKDFCLHGAKSSIGRRKESSVCLADEKISRDGFPALIVYDDRKTHRFYLASGDASSHNNVELDGNMLLGQSILNPYDEIRIEDTVLVFVPFCGDDFHWNGN